MQQSTFPQLETPMKNRRPSRPRTRAISADNRLHLALIALLAAAMLLAAISAMAQQDVPEGYVQIMERGGIPAIDDPSYVTAAEARIRDDAWVLGVVIDGQARAYSLELLNGHEVVNDSIGDTDFAAVW